MELENLINELSEKISKNSNVKTIFGEPIEVGDITIINVGKVNYTGGFGFGGGKDEEDKSEGTGGGGGGNIKITPVGYIEITENSTVFKPILDVRETMKIAFLFGAGIFLISRIFKRK